MTTCLGKSCSFGLPRVPFINFCQFMYFIISILVLRAGCGSWLYQFLIIAYHFTLHHSYHTRGWLFGNKQNQNWHGTQKMIIHDRDIKGFTIQSATGVARTSKSLVIPAKTGVDIAIRVSRRHPKYNSPTWTSAFIDQANLAGAECLVTLHKNEATFTYMLMNPTENNIKHLRDLHVSVATRFFRVFIFVSS